MPDEIMRSAGGNLSNVLTAVSLGDRLPPCRARLRPRSSGAQSAHQVRRELQGQVAPEGDGQKDTEKKWSGNQGGQHGECAMSTWAIVLGAGLLLLLALGLTARLIASDDHHEPF
jgi:type VI protein secretion system component VasF